MIIQVVVDLPLNRSFDYRSDDATVADVGRRVLVPFGRRKLIGMIIGATHESAVEITKLKRADTILRDITPCSAEEMSLFAFCSQYYLHPLGEVILNALPPLLRRTKPVLPPSPTHFALTPAGKTEAVAVLPARARVAREVLQAMQNNQVVSVDNLRQISPSAAKSLKLFVQRGWVTAAKPAAGAMLADVENLPKLTAEQAEALNTVSAEIQKFQVTLLHGITGSGKTEVYLRLIAEVVARGGRALVLVPEINLTPQLESVFRERFPNVSIASLHSHLNDTERLNHW
ncbi:MAG: DEAD/DEAH box helicase family protein, partial [Burkholderiales bacterium]